MSDTEQYGSFFVFDGIQTNNYGVWVSGTETYAAPERDVEFLSIPGRSGDLFRDNGRFQNIEIEYPCFIPRGFERRFGAFKAALLSRVGYKRLEDTYHPNAYRMAAYTGPMEPVTGILNRSGKFTVSFNCQPQLWLKSGEETVTFTAAGSIYNPTLFEARPILRVYGAGVLGVGAVTVTVAKNPFTFIDIDCAAMDAVSGAANANPYITLSGDDFPALRPGATGITLGTGITKCEITPRWWTV